MENVLTDKIILITGGSSRLGSAFVQKALDQGAQVFFTYYSKQDEAKKLIDLGAVGYQLDLSSVDKLSEFVDEFKKKAPSLDALIHNAAAVRDQTTQNLTEDDWDYVMRVNVKAPYFLSKKLLRLLFKKKPSKILMLTSRAAFVGAYGAANYAASKAAVVAMAKSLAKELGRKKVLVNALNPGFMISSMTENLPEKIMQKHKEASPIEQYSSPEEVANFLVHFCSDQMNQVTGQVISWESRDITFLK